MNQKRAVIKLWDFLEEQAGGLFLLMAVLLVAGQIFARAVFGLGISGLYELATYFALCSVFLTSSLAIKANLHIRIDILANIVSQRNAFRLELLAMIVMAFVSGALCWSGVLLVIESYVLGEKTIGTISLHVWILQLILPLAGGLMLLRSFQRFWKVFQQGAENYRVEISELEVI